MKKVVLIVGGGIAGLTAALALQQKNIDFIVFEAVSEIKGIGAGITLAGNAMRALRRLGIQDDVKQRGTTLNSMIIHDDNGKPISIMDVGKLNLQYELDNIAIHRAELHQALLKPIAAEKIITNKRAIDFEENEGGVKVFFDDGTFAEGSAAIVADGINSSIRKKLIPSSMPRYAGYTCWRGIVENTWNIKDYAVETWGISGRFGYVPVGFNKVYWFACKNASYNDIAMKKYTIEDLARNFKSYADPIPAILRQTPGDRIIWNDIIDLKPIHQFAFGKVVLIGDAAHATTPNLGQGACMAMEDAVALADEMEKHADSLTRAFKEFEKKRIPRTHYIVNTSYRLGNIAQWENKILCKIRNTLFRLTPASVNERQMKKLLEV